MEKKMKLKKFGSKKIALAFILGFLTYKTISFAEAIGPVGNAMHSMIGAYDCLSGKLPAFMCKIDSTAAPEVQIAAKLKLVDEMDGGAKLGRSALLQFHKDSPDDVVALNGLFDRLDLAIGNLRQAVTENDPVKTKQAMLEIRNVKSDAHDQFQPPDKP
jgi:hypothetical protein